MCRNKEKTKFKIQNVKLMDFIILVFTFYILFLSAAYAEQVKNPVPRAQGVKSQNKFILSFSGLTGESSSFFW
ncbi:MAG: hypothetical protein CVV37_05610, partial [Nitrospira bacterium HGW-Nitrospira-1]